jgi:hypothetical protein
MCGAFAAVGAMCKQIGGPLTVPIALYVATGVWSHAALSPRSRLRMLMGFCLGVIMPVVVVLLWFWIAGGLNELYYYVITYNKDIYMVYADAIPRWPGYKAWASKRPVELMLAASAIGWGLAQFVRGVAGEGRLSAGYARQGFAITLALICALSVFGARASTREFNHYYILCVPWFGLLAGVLVEQASDFASQLQRTPLYAFVTSVLVLSPAALVTEIGYADRTTPTALDENTSRMAPLEQAAKPLEVCRLIQQHTKPSDTLFVWGFRPQLYVSCARRPASRYVFTTFVAGYVPWFDASTLEEENEHAVPGSRAVLLHELELTKPPVIVDSGISTGNRHMARYPELARYLDEHYRPLPKVGVDLIYLRK